MNRPFCWRGTFHIFIDQRAKQQTRWWRRSGPSGRRSGTLLTRCSRCRRRIRRLDPLPVPGGAPPHPPTQSVAGRRSTFKTLQRLFIFFSLISFMSLVLSSQPQPATVFWRCRYRYYIRTTVYTGKGGGERGRKKNEEKKKIPICIFFPVASVRKGIGNTENISRGFK